ncbi:MAG: T9SS type A sorting domain-containing protein [Ignavibacteriaceae bacterium]|nr:T9SS type A sorting domain-containing protein [Ignavibacteriaceae bacterium]
MKVILLFIIALTSNQIIFSQSWADYLNPSDTTINSNDQLTIYGRLRIDLIPPPYNTDTNYTAKLHISASGTDPRGNPSIIFDATFDKYIDSARQYKVTAIGVSQGQYWFCYGYYQNNSLMWAGGIPNNNGWFMPGNLTVTPATDLKYEEEIPFQYQLSQNFPNPFNPVTRIRYSIPQSSFVTLKVYNILGKEISTLVNEEKSVGNYEVDFEGGNLTSGIYFYKIESGSFTDTKKFILLK